MITVIGIVVGIVIGIFILAMMMDESFKSRLGRSQKPVQEVERNGEEVEGGRGKEEESGKGLEMAGSVVLVVIDVNKELSTSALDWALGSVVQKGDSVKLLGVLHHIFNPSKFGALSVVEEAAAEVWGD